MQRCQASWLSKLYAKSSSPHILQLHSHSSQRISASCFLLCSPTIPALHPLPPGEQAEAMRQVKPSTPQPQPTIRSRAEQSLEVTVENADQKPKDKQLQTKPAEPQRVLHPRHLHIKDLGQERSLCPVSTWPVTASLKDALTSARQWLTTLISQGQVRSSPQPKVCFLVWTGFCGRCYGAHSRAVRGREKCCFLQKYMHSLHLPTAFLYIL